MATTEETLQSLRGKINQATAAQARAQVQRDNATKARDDALEALKEFGVTTPEQAREKLATLEGDLATALEQVESALEASGE